MMKQTKIIHYPTYEETLKQSQRYIQVVAQRLNQDEHIDDLLNEGRLGLWEAWKKYNPSTGPFHSLAIVYIKYTMLNYLSNNARTIRIPVSIQRKIDFYENVTISTDTDLVDDYHSSTVGDMLEADVVEYWDEEHFNESLDDAQDAQRRLLRQFLSELKPNYQKIFLMREIDSMSFQQIGDELGMTKANALDIYRKAVTKMQLRFEIDVVAHKSKKIFPNGNKRKVKT